VRQQHWNIFAALAQRRQLQVNHIQAVIQILAESPFANQRQQINIGRRDDAHIDLELLGPAQPHEFAFLNHAQQLCLCLRANRRDFIEENRSLVGNFK